MGASWMTELVQLKWGMSSWIIKPVLWLALSEEEIMLPIRTIMPLIRNDHRVRLLSRFLLMGLLLTKVWWVVPAFFPIIQLTFQAAIQSCTWIAVVQPWWTCKKRLILLGIFRLIGLTADYAKKVSMSVAIWKKWVITLMTTALRVSQWAGESKYL